MEAALRRYQDSLVIIGTGVIILGLWSVIKMVLLILTGGQFIPEEYAGPDRKAERIIFIVFIAIFLAIDLGLRLYIGRSAQAEGHGRRRPFAYAVVAGLLALASVGEILFILSNTSSVLEAGDPVDLAVSILIEATNAVTLVELVISAVRVRQLSRAAA